MKRNKTHRMMHIAMLSGLAVVLMFFDFPLPFFPPFLKFDASDAIVFASSIFVGPLGMMMIIILRSILHWLLRGAEMGIPVGQLTSIVSSASFCLTAYYVIKKSRFKNEKLRLILGLVSGSLVMTIIMFGANYFWITPFYFSLGNMPLPENYFNYMLLYIPFNLVKGLLNSAVIFVLLPYLKQMKNHR